MTEGTAVFLVQPGVLPPELAACAVVQVAGVVFRVTIAAPHCGPLAVEVAELDPAELLPGRDPWRPRARGDWSPRPLRGRYVADVDGGREVGPLGDLRLLEVLGEALDEHQLAAIREAADAAMQVRADMSKETHGEVPAEVVRCLKTWTST